MQRCRPSFVGGGTQPARTPIAPATAQGTPAPVLIRTQENGQDEALFGVLVAEHSPQKANALEILRAELNRQAAASKLKPTKMGYF